MTLDEYRKFEEHPDDNSFLLIPKSDIIKIYYIKK